MTPAVALTLTLTLASAVAPPAPAPSPPAAPPTRPTLLLVVGAPGATEYADRFRHAAATWQKAAARGQVAVTTIGLDAAKEGAAGPSDRQRLQDALAASATGWDPLWLVLIGHGTFDGRAARFNLRGPDFSEKDLAGWLRPVRRPLILINTASASAPFLRALAGPERIIVTATKSGHETSAPRFGPWLAEAIADLRADLDRDGGVSLLEAFLHASKRVEASFSEEGLLASEHPLLEDNGDGLGTSAAFYRGLAPASSGAKGRPPSGTPPDAASQPTLDGARARLVALMPAPPERALPESLRRRRDQLETEVLALREKRATLAESVYYARLERLLYEIARLYQRAEREQTQAARDGAAPRSPR